MFIPEIFIAKNHPAEKLARMLWQAHRHAREAVRQALMTTGSSEMTKVAAITAADTV